MRDIDGGAWLSIADYSRYKNVSVSTIRRHLKNNILKYKEENGKYYIYVASVEKIQNKDEEEILKAKLEIEFLRNELRKINEENSALKMLVEIYEKKSLASSTDQPPEIPLNS